MLHDFSISGMHAKSIHLDFKYEIQQINYFAIDSYQISVLSSFSYLKYV